MSTICKSDATQSNAVQAVEGDGQVDVGPCGHGLTVDVALVWARHWKASMPWYALCEAGCAGEDIW